ncbi:hypothetical protein PR002_g21123 [Phytophthora rubi]|uniref:Fe2OG dioxygenase domain-containing protein n=1 Tax=Phytophthora rubi TaxID=129364 RepID=A0A6A3JG29_9STRA|nr:hypothetical protein PR002_g21123 [Phytophthora rubi]
MAWTARRKSKDSDDVETHSSDEEEELGPLLGKWPFGGKGKSSDVPVPEGATCKKINIILAQAGTHAGEFTFGGVADTLPAVPGLFVDGVGQIPVPLTEDYATKLIDKCEKSPYGHNFDTKMDDSVRNSWQLQPDRVKFKNPLWQSGVDKLTQVIAERLGYKSVSMECKLYKLLVYGEGGHFLKHQDTEKEDGMVATLVVQLPSTHEGGDLIIYRGGEVKHRHDFGKKDGTAAYLPHYAVHYADAEHALEKVTKGYRVVLVYSLCLPLAMRHLKRDHDKLMSEELADAISTVGPDKELFALLLAHEYTEKSIGDLGSGALKGIDRARFVALEEANAAVPVDKKLQFYIAQVTHEIEYYGNEGYEPAGWEEYSRKNTVTWFSTSGQRFGPKKLKVKKMNFLNPGYETYYELWRTHGSSKMEGFMGNEGPSMNTKYSRYAIVAWPAAHGVENALKFINAEAAIGALENQKPVNAAALGEFMNKIVPKLEKERGKSRPISTEFCCVLCELLVDAGDAALVNLFFNKCFSMLFARLQSEETVVPILVKMLRSLSWNDVGQACLESFGQLGEVKTMTMALQVADGLDDGTSAKNALMQLALENAVKLSDTVIIAPVHGRMLWTWVIRSDDSRAFDMLANKVKNMDPRSMGPPTEAFTQCLTDIDPLGDKFAALKAIADKRRAWLESQIQQLDKPFSWEMPGAEFPDNAKVEAFLRGPDTSMTTKEVCSFKKLRDAQNYAAKWMRASQGEASYVMEATEENGAAFVTITKTKGWASSREKLLQQYKAELNILAKCFADAVTSNSRKRARPGQ